MQILASPPFRTGSIVWQERSGQHTLTVVCKATYALSPLSAALAEEPEDVNDRDNHWDDDPLRSLYLPSDLAPLKPHPEVLLVGSAFAPRGEAVRSLHVRVIVGELDKSLEVFCARSFSLDGALHEGPRWKQMPLLYERAAGGDGSWNPVGLGPDMVDRYGRRPVPNLQPLGTVVGERGDTIPPVGFGPIAPSWPDRRQRLRDRAATWSDARWMDEPLGDGFDATFFQAAPLDQRVAELRPDEPIVLENLHPKHPRLVTRLGGVRPRARVEMPDLPAWDLLLVADTLWIDTQRAICTLTWRGQVPLGERDQPGMVRIAAEEPGKPLRWPSSDAPPPPPPRPPGARAPGAPGRERGAEIGPGADPDADQDFAHTVTDDIALRAAMPRPALPFQRSGVASKPPPLPRKPIGNGHAEGDERGETGLHPVVERRGAMPSWLGPVPPPPPSRSELPPRPPLASSPPPPLSSRPMRLEDGFAGSPGGVAASSAAVRAPPPPPPSSGFAVRPPAPSDPLGPPRVDERVLSGATYAGVLEASNAAADPPPAAKRRGTLRSDPSLPAPRTLIELIWHDPAKVGRIRKTPAWEPLLRPPAPPPPPAPEGDAEAAREAADAKARAERADVAAVLARAAPALDVEGAMMDAASEDGDLEPPLVVVAGELELGLDEVKMLEAMLGAAASFAAGDKKLKEVIDLAGEVMRTPLGGSPGVAAGFVARVREAWAKANRLLPADYLDVHTRRLLLEQRCYQKRELWNDAYIRALLAPAGEGSGIPTYLPATLAKQLPLFARFPARVLAEAFPQQDQLESHPVALRAVALGRALSGRARR